MLVPVIGLEIHVELSTKSKMFCQCSADYFGKEPNINICPVCLGYPGALPVPNRKAIEWTILLASSLNCKIRNRFKFDRKHYFYPDLPKGYQISQYDTPIGYSGYLEIDALKSGKFEGKRYRIRRVHLEEDTGKLIHQKDETLIDFNRSGVPLVEIVTEPDFRDSEDVVRFLEEMQILVRYLGISDADMEKGSMRLEPNVSWGELLENGEVRFLGYKVELKNINSFRFAKRAIEYELERQKKIIEKGELPVQETRGFNEDKGITFSQRRKEEAQDYKYFPEPDIPQIEFSKSEINTILSKLPELPLVKRRRFVEQYKIKYSDAFILTKDSKVADFYEKAVKSLQKENISNLAQKVANAIVNRKIELKTFSVEEFAKEFLKLYKPIKTDLKLVEEVVKKVIANNQKAVEDFKKGKENAAMFLVGQAMRELRGKADANKVKEIVIEFLRKQ